MISEIPNNMVVTTDLVVIIFGVVAVAVAITIWAVRTFQTKEDATNVERRIEQGIATIWDQLNTYRDDMSKIAQDVSYIRGRVEPHGD